MLAMAKAKATVKCVEAVSLSNGGNAWQVFNVAGQPVVGGLLTWRQDAPRGLPGILPAATEYTSVFHGAHREYCMDPQDPAFEEGWERQRNRRQMYKERRKRRDRRPSWLGVSMPIFDL